MKTVIKWLLNSIVLMSLLTFSCEKENNSTSKTNHTVIINSQAANNPVQFGYLKITPTDASSTAIRNDFVLNPGSTLSIKVNLPKTGTYSIEVGGPSQTIVWASIMLDSNNGTTNIDLIKTQTYCLNSRCSSILATSCNP